MTAPNFRNDARRSVERAKAELAANDDYRLRYAALELRFAIEALTYDRAHAYRDDIAPEEYATWQPRKLIQLMLDINPDADQSSTLRVGEEKVFGEPAPTMEHLGSEEVLGLSAIKHHYDALGAFLHTPTLKQAQSGGLDLAKLRTRCEVLASALDRVLQSTVWNINFGNYSTLDCMECRKKIRRRIPNHKETLEIGCFECPASYRVSNQASGKVHWHPLQAQIRCASDGCDGIMIIWQREFKPGACWTCKTCNEPYIVGLGIRRDNGTQPANASV